MTKHGKGAEPDGIHGHFQFSLRYDTTCCIEVVVPILANL